MGMGPMAMGTGDISFVFVSTSCLQPAGNCNTFFTTVMISGCGWHVVVVRVVRDAVSDICADRTSTGIGIVPPLPPKR